MPVLLPSVKGVPRLIASNAQLNGLLDMAIDCQEANALSLQILVAGNGASATVEIDGATSENGTYLKLPDINASQTVTANTAFDVTVGSPFAKVRISNIAGDFSQGGGYTIWATPFVSPGNARVAASIVVDTLAAITANIGAAHISDVLDIAAAGGLYQGSGTFASPTTGLKIWNSGGRGVITQYLNGSKLWELSASGLWLNPVIAALSGSQVVWSSGGVTYLALGTEVDLGNVTGVIMENLSSVMMTIASDAGLFLSASKLGFFATPPAAKPTVSGSRGSNAALASLLTGLASLGLITDSSTA